MARTKGYNLGVNWKIFDTPRKDALKAPRLTLIRYGPEHHGLRAEPDPHGGPEAFAKANPQLFATSSTSKPEAYFYWALLKLRGEPGPEGGWQYQRRVQPGGQKLGQATVDFLIASRPKDIACRIVTPFFHLGFGPEKAGSDLEQIYALQEAGYDVIDAFSSLYIRDKSGGAVLKMAERVIAKDPSLSPLSHTYLGRF